MTTKTKTGRASHKALSRLVTMELEAFSEGHGADMYIHLPKLAENTGLTVALTEEVVRSMNGVCVVPADDVIESQPDFPKTTRKGGEKGYYPGVKLETEHERSARTTRNAMVLKASECLQELLAPLGLDLEFNATTGAFLLTATDENLPDAVAPVLLYLA